jgi:hypothetical protein
MAIVAGFTSAPNSSKAATRIRPTQIHFMGATVCHIDVQAFGRCTAMCAATQNWTEQERLARRQRYTRNKTNTCCYRRRESNAQAKQQYSSEQETPDCYVNPTGEIQLEINCSVFTLRIATVASGHGVEQIGKVGGVPLDTSLTDRSSHSRSWSRTEQQLHAMNIASAYSSEQRLDTPSFVLSLFPLALTHVQTTASHHV